jgi:hypothetical protein
MRLTQSRRRFLRSVGLASAAAMLPFTRGILKAEGPTVPVRFVGLKYCNGIQPGLWYPEGSGDDFALAALPTLLAPFEPVKSKILVLENLSLAASLGPGGSHDTGMVTFLTGRENREGSPGGISLDVHLGERLGASMPFPNLVLGSGPRASGPFGSISWRAAGEQNRAQFDPIAAYDRVFASLSESGTTEEMARLREEKQSVLDHVATDLHDLSLQLGGDDRRRLEFHLESLRELERSLEAPTTHCGAPDLGDTAFDFASDASLPVVSRLQMDIAVNALACRLTHFLTHNWSHGAGSITFPWLGIGTGMHDLSHWNQDPDTLRPQHQAALQWHMEEVAYFLGRLDAIVEEDGQTLLDHSAVLLGTDNGESRGHEINHIPFLLAGRGGGAFRTGRCIRYPDPTPHNDLLVAVANATGDPIETFGDEEHCNGPLARLA